METDIDHGKLHSQPLVTVVIPVFNAEDYLRETLDSVFAQTLSDFEVIAVDDGSKDQSLALLNNYPGPVKVLTHPGNSNKGQYASINLAIENAGSKYIAFIDSDDLWAEDKLKAQIEVLESEPDAVLAYTNGYAIDAAGDILYPLFDEFHIEPNSNDEILLDCYIRMPSSVVVRRKALVDVGLFDGSIMPGDHDMWIKLSEKHRFVYLDEKLAFYRRHEGQLSGSRKQWEDGFHVLDRAKRRHSYSRETIRKRLAVLHYRLGSHDLKNKRIRFAPMFLKAFWYDPKRAISVVRQSLGF